MSDTYKGESPLVDRLLGEQTSTQRPLFGAGGGGAR